MGKANFSHSASQIFIFIIIVFLIIIIVFLIIFNSCLLAPFLLLLRQLFFSYSTTYRIRANTALA